MKEVWKKIKGHKYHEVSNLGRVRSLTRKIRHQTIQGQIMSQHKLPNGYMKCSIRQNGKRSYFLVHRLVAESFLKKIKDKTQVNHKNGLKDDNRLSNVEWCDSSENQNHALKNGLCSNGEKHYKSKLTEDNVRDIRNRTDKSYRLLAIEYNVDKSTIFAIKNFKTWKYVK